ncbi:MAG: hypothetical protein H6Q04_2267 [Acidobacteria bacterium]|nr:hypothetical protein [Acidobacteriota bacterium]
MAVSKKTSKASTVAKQKIIILAVYPEGGGLTETELKKLERALKTAGEKSVESHESLEIAVHIAAEGHIWA